MERITFQNKGNTVVGNLFRPDGFEQGTRYPAIVVTHPFGAVKEQVSTTYAKLLAAQGFVTLVFDASYQGESGGEPHFSEFPAARVEDIRCAVDFLSNYPDVDADRIGGIRETRETREMLDFCAEHHLGADIEIIPAQKINEAYERVLASDVCYRFVIDTSTLA